MRDFSRKITTKNPNVQEKIHFNLPFAGFCDHTFEG